MNVQHFYQLAFLVKGCHIYRTIVTIFRHRFGKNAIA